MFHKQTLAQIIAKANQGITDLRTAASDSNALAKENTKKAAKIMAVVKTQRGEAAHASILADRMTRQLHVSQDEIDSLVKTMEWVEEK